MLHICAFTVIGINGAFGAPKRHCRGRSSRPHSRCRYSQHAKRVEDNKKKENDSSKEPQPPADMPPPVPGKSTATAFARCRRNRRSLIRNNPNRRMTCQKCILYKYIQCISTEHTGQATPKLRFWLRAYRDDGR